MKIHTVELPLGEPGRHEVVLLADHGQALAKMLAERDAVQAQLAQAVGLLIKARRYVEQDHPDGIHSYQPNSISGDLLGDVDAFLARHAQAEQQEAQGAQAGDERRECCNEECGWEGITDRMLGAIGPLCPECGETTERAALATQPADDRAREMGYRSAINALDDLDRYKMAMSPATAVPEATQQQLNDLNNFFNSVCEGGLHSVEKAGIQSLTELGALENCGFGKHRLTRFGTYLIEQPAVRGAEHE